MNEDKLREIYEQIDPGHEIPQDKMEELIMALDDIRLRPPVDGQPVDGVPGVYHGVLESDLKSQLVAETDYRKKASLAAKIISLNLE